MYRLTLNILLSLIDKTKITGKKTGRGKIYVKLMRTIADHDNSELRADQDIINKFGYIDFKSMDKHMFRFHKNGQNYPYEIIHFRGFEQSFGNSLKYSHYLYKMRNFCDEFLDKLKIDSFIYTLLEIMRQDIEIKTVLYGCNYVPKEKFFGSYAHPKRICIEALLLGLLYYCHKNPAKAESIELIEANERLTFHAERYSDEKSLDFDMPINLIDNIRINAERQKPVEMKYQPDLKYKNISVDKLHENKNIFLYGSGGAGKTVFLLNQIKNKNTVNFYFPLYEYNNEVHDNFQNISCWILLQILLKYHYQYEYHKYEALIANEGEKSVLQQLTELQNVFENNPDNWTPEYTLFLDGLNEMSSDTQLKFVSELDFICQKWKNVRIIITGRNIPDYDLFHKFQSVEICGITDSELNTALSDFPDCSEKLKKILKKPLFLNIYIQSQNTENKINTRGELLDYYIMNRKIKLSGCFLNNIDSSVILFIIQYILPFIARDMVDNYNFFAFTENKGVCFEIDRGDLFRAIDKAYETYLLNELIYQSYISPKGFRKKVLLESRTENNFIEIILENIGLMKISENNPQKICFTHQYFRDYFAAKQILNLLEVIKISYNKSSIDEKKEIFRKLNLDKTWFSPDCEYEIYKLIGEICGDYKNTADKNNDFWGDENFWYQRTILDRILDMYREFGSETDEFHITENIMTTMGIIRNGVICGVNFDRIPLPFNIPCNVRFSLNGECPCTFRHCRVERLEIFSAGNNIWGRYSVCSPDKNFILIIIDNNYVILWSVRQQKIVRDYNLSEYAENNIDFNYAEFSPEGQYIIFRAYNGYNMKIYELKIEMFTGKIISYNSENIQIYDMERDFIDENLKCRIFSQLTHFKNCSFTGAEFMDEDYRNYLYIMGAILD